MLESNVTIRIAAKEDISSVALMFERDHEASYPGHQMTQETLSRAKSRVDGLVAQRQGFILVAVEANTNAIKGFIAVDLVEFVPTGELYPRIASLFVDPASRGRGVATQLKMAAEEELVRRGFDEVVSQVAATNTKMIDLNKRLGYEIESYVFCKSIR